jgi:hypothetical protein
MTMNKGIVKVPSYLVDMVLMEGKTLMIQIEDKIVSKFNKDTIESAIKEIESKVYKGKFNQEDIEYHLIQIRLEIKTNKTKAKVLAT